MNIPKILLDSHSFTLEHNPSWVYYESVEDYLDHSTMELPCVDREAMIKSNTIYEATWYPCTPVSHEALAASSLEVLFVALEDLL